MEETEEVTDEEKEVRRLRLWRNEEEGSTRVIEKKNRSRNSVCFLGNYERTRKKR